MTREAQYELKSKLRELGYSEQIYFLQDGISLQYATIGITQEADQLQKMFPNFRVTPFPNQQEIEFRPK